MPEKETLKRAKAAKRAKKALSTQAGEFVREEIHHVREGKHGARSTKQAYELRIELGQNFSCNYQGATGWWDNLTPAASHTIAKLCVH